MRQKTLDNKRMSSFRWHRKQSSNIGIALKGAREEDREILIQLMMGVHDVRCSTEDDLKPEDYLILLDEKKAIAAIKCTNSSGVFSIEDVYVHPMYPENSITKGVYLLLKGWGGRLPA